MTNKFDQEEKEIAAEMKEEIAAKKMLKKKLPKKKQMQIRK